MNLIDSIKVLTTISPTSRLLPCAAINLHGHCKTVSVSVKTRVPNIINIAFLQVKMACIVTEFFVVWVARLDALVDIHGISASRNCNSVGCADTKPRPGRTLDHIQPNSHY